MTSITFVDLFLIFATLQLGKTRNRPSFGTRQAQSRANNFWRTEMVLERAKLTPVAEKSGRSVCICQASVGLGLSQSGIPTQVWRSFRCYHSTADLRKLMPFSRM